MKNLESEFTNLQKRMDLLVNNLSGIVYRCKFDRNWTMEYISEACYQLTGYSPIEIVSNSVIWNDLILPEFRKGIWDKVSLALVDRSQFNFSFQIRTKNGEVKWMFEQGSGIYDEQGEVIAIEGYISDITKIKILEEKLSDVILKKDIITEILNHHVNYQDFKQLVYDAFEMFGVHLKLDLICNFIYNKGDTRVEPILWWITEHKEFIKEGLHIVDLEIERLSFKRIHPYTKNNCPVGFKVLMDSNNLSRLWVSAVVIDTEVNIVVLGCCDDRNLSKTDVKLIETGYDLYKIISVKNKYLDNLNRSERNFRKIFNFQNDSIVIMKTTEGNYDYPIIEANDAFLRLTGYSKDEVLQMSVRSFYQYTHSHQENRAVYFQNLREFGEDTRDIEIKSKCGERIPVEVKSQFFSYKGHKTIMVVARNITDRKEYQKELISSIIEAEEKERVRLAEDLHDDLGPLLTAINLYATSLKNINDKETSGYVVDQISKIANEALSTAKQISYDMYPQKVLRSGLEEGIEALIHRCNEFLKVILMYSVKLDSIKKSKEVMIFRIVKELLNNTIKYAEAQKAIVSLYNIGEKIIIQYKDNGVGFDFEQINRAESMGLNNIINRVQLCDGKIQFKRGQDNMSIVITLNDLN